MAVFVSIHVLQPGSRADALLLALEDGFPGAEVTRCSTGNAAVALHESRVIAEPRDSPAQAAYAVQRRLDTIDSTGEWTQYLQVADPADGR